MISREQDDSATRNVNPQEVLEEGSGLSFKPAQTVEELASCWELVFRRYLDGGLIPNNPFRIHTVPEAMNEDVMVVLGRIKHLCVSTMTAIKDTGHGIPLDSVYKKELDELRAQGRRLTEVGLFADRREHVSRSATALFDLMRWVYCYAYHNGSDDIMIGVHPHHEKFYRRCFGFIQIGEEKSYATVNDNPVVLLQLDMRAQMNRNRPPRGVRYFMENWLEADSFQDRVSVHNDEMRSSRVGEYVLAHWPKLAGRILPDAGGDASLSVSA